jgi:hypothetical protein
MRLLDPPTEQCVCGGWYRLDVQYLIDAERFSIRDIPVLWRCNLCGRSLTSEGRHVGHLVVSTTPERDPCGESLLDQLTDGRGARGRPRSRRGRPAHRRSSSG